MKKHLILLFALCFSVAIFSGCQSLSREREASATQKILIIGNSHSVDAFYLLPQAYKDQYPEENILFGVLYYQGCSISEHVDFSENNEPVYKYYKNTNGTWKIRNGMSMKAVLQDQEWSTIILQAAKSDLDDTLNESGRRALESYVNQHVKNPHGFLWHTSWPSPNDERFFSSDWAVQAPEGYKENLIRLYDFDPIKQYTVLVEKAKAHILPDKTYSKAICTGTSIMHAYLSASCPQTDLWRDYTHLTDFGRLIAAYSMVTQITQQPLETIAMQSVPKKLRHEQFKKEGNLVITESMKEVIMNAANYALAEPFGMPTANE